MPQQRAGVKSADRVAQRWGSRAGRAPAGQSCTGFGIDGIDGRAGCAVHHGKARAGRKQLHYCHGSGQYRNLA